MEFGIIFCLCEFYVDQFGCVIVYVFFIDLNKTVERMLAVISLAVWLCFVFIDLNKNCILGQVMCFLFFWSVKLLFLLYLSFFLGFSIMFSNNVLYSCCSLLFY